MEDIRTGGTNILEKVLVKVLGGMPPRESSSKGGREQLWGNVGTFLRRGYDSRYGGSHVVMEG